MLKIDPFGIEINDESFINSDLSDFMSWERAEAMEMMILGQYIAGIDISSKEYALGLHKAVDMINRNRPENYLKFSS